LANRIAERMDLRKIHAKLDRIAQQFCPVVKALWLEYHWSLMKVEYSTDIIFKKREDLQAILSASAGTPDSLRQTGEHRHFPWT